MVDSSSIHHYIFWSDQCYHRVHLIVEFHLYGSLDGLLLSPSTTSLSPPWFGWTSKLALETFESIFLVLAHEVYVLMEEVTSSSSRAYDASCRRELEKVCFASSGIIPSQSCIRAKYSLVWRLATFILYESLAHQATDWFVQGKEVLKCYSLRTQRYMRMTSLSAMMVPNQNSVVFYSKTTMWSCLSGTACSHVVAEPAHVLELAIVVHPLRISQRHLVDLCCKLSFSF